jgi:hypothetical protein
MLTNPVVVTHSNTAINLMLEAADLQSWALRYHIIKQSLGQAPPPGPGGELIISIDSCN